MDVLAVDRRDEALVDPGVDREGQDVRLMFDVLDLSHQLRRPARIGEELIQETCRCLEMLRQLVEEIEELLIARDQAVQHAVRLQVESPEKLPGHRGRGNQRGCGNANALVIPSERSESRDLHLSSRLPAQQRRNADLKGDLTEKAGSVPLRVE